MTAGIFRYPRSRLVSFGIGAGAAGLVLFLASLPPWLPIKTRSDLIDFFAEEGCAIGPSTRERALAAGFDGSDIDALVELEGALVGAVKTGEWLVLAPESCTIQLPKVTSRVRITDPELTPRFRDEQDESAEGGPACYLPYGTDIYQNLRRSRGWDADTANAEYLGVITNGFITKQLANYGEDRLATPYSYYDMSGECAEGAMAQDIRDSQDFLITNFDPLVRAIFEESFCEEGHVWLERDPNTIAGIAPGTRTKNAWISLEINVMAMAAGWYEGMNATEKGQPRPPICHYQTQAMP